MNILTRHDLTGCATSAELAALLEKAFTQWRPDQPDGRGRRETPRVGAGDVGPLYLVAYAFNGRDVALHRRAPFIDVSADGLGVRLGFPLPAGAALCFAFEDDNGERNYGFALVAHSRSIDDGYRVGLMFAEKAGTLDVHGEGDEFDGTRETGRRWRYGFDRFRFALSQGFTEFKGKKLAEPCDTDERPEGNKRPDGDSPRAKKSRFARGWSVARYAFHNPPGSFDEAFRADGKGFTNALSRGVERCGVAYATAKQSHAACRELGAELYNRRASVVIEAKLFRYQAALYVDGQRVASQAGRMRDRLENLFSPSGRPTMVHLEGGGFAAWAAVRPNAVADAGIDVCMPIKQRMIEQLRGSQPVGSGKGRTKSDDSAKPDSA